MVDNRKEQEMKKQVQDLEKILKRPENQICADCNNKTPRWASITFGVFVCLRCSGKNHFHLLLNSGVIEMKRVRVRN